MRPPYEHAAAAAPKEPPQRKCNARVQNPYTKTDAINFALD